MKKPKEALAMRLRVKQRQAKPMPRTKAIVETRGALVSFRAPPAPTEQSPEPVSSRVLSQDKFKIGPKLREFMDGEHGDALLPTPRKPKP